MSWKVVHPNRPQPARGTYPDWKEQIAQECHRQCVYCTITEAEFGGIANFQVDHYRPRSRFDGLINIITNLFLACGICNRFKSDHWTVDPDHAGSHPTIPDPGIHDLAIHFAMAPGSWQITGTTISGRFTAERLYLNRPQLITQRRKRACTANLANLNAALDSQVTALMARHGDSTALQLLGEVSRALLAVERIRARLDSEPPYTVADIRRPSPPSRAVAARSKRTRLPNDTGTRRGRKLSLVAQARRQRNKRRH